MNKFSRCCSCPKAIPRKEWGMAGRIFSTSKRGSATISAKRSLLTRHSPPFNCCKRSVDNFMPKARAAWPNSWVSKSPDPSKSQRLATKCGSFNFRFRPKLTRNSSSSQVSMELLVETADSASRSSSGGRSWVEADTKSEFCPSLEPNDPSGDNFICKSGLELSKVGSRLWPCFKPSDFGLVLLCTQPILESKQPHLWWWKCPSPNLLINSTTPRSPQRGEPKLRE